MWPEIGIFQKKFEKNTWIIKPFEYLTKKMQNSLNQHFNSYLETEGICRALEGKHLFESLKRIKENDIDLVVIGM